MEALHCPKCGDPLTLRNGELTCIRGNMGLSATIASELLAEFGPDSLVSRAAPLKYVAGGTWFCPCCGLPMSESNGNVSCRTCGRSLNRFLYHLVELHPHESVQRASHIS